MLTAVLADAGHPVVAGLLGLGAAGLAAAVVVMAWSVHVHQIRLAELLARRQFLVTSEALPAAQAVNGNGKGNGHSSAVGGGAEAVAPEGTRRPPRVWPSPWSSTGRTPSSPVSRPATASSPRGPGR